MLEGIKARLIGESFLLLEIKYCVLIVVKNVYESYNKFGDCRGNL